MTVLEKSKQEKAKLEGLNYIHFNEYHYLEEKRLAKEQERLKKEVEQKGKIRVINCLFEYLAAESKLVEKPMTELEKSKQEKAKLEGLNYILF
jgi:hypothetical protein